MIHVAQNVVGILILVACLFIAGKLLIEALRVKLPDVHEAYPLRDVRRP